MFKLGKPRSSRGLAVFCARIAEEKLARDTLILSLQKIEISPTDYFVICTCDSDAQMHAIADEVLNQCRQAKIKRPKIEGGQGSFWLLLDFFDVVMHIMLSDAREFYRLEKLWSDSQFYKLDDTGKPKALGRNDLKLFLK